jgi:hypothetical protein
MRHHTFPKSMLVFAGFLLIGGAAGYYTFFTTPGSRQLTEKYFWRYWRVQGVSSQEDQGNLSEGYRLKDVELSGIKWLPEGSIVRIQDFVLRLSAWNVEGIDLEIENARLVLPRSQPIVLFVKLKEGLLTANIFAPALNIGQILGLFPFKEVKGSMGSMTDMDVNISGFWQQPRLEGHFYVNELTQEEFRVVNCPGNLALELQLTEKPRINGSVNLERGNLKGPRTAIVDLDPSRILFKGDPVNPELDIRARSKVEDVNITIVLKGNAQKPEMDLSSAPPYFPERLLVMLATGKKWQGTDDMLLNKNVPVELAKDFIEYFAFSGTGQMLAERYGITDIQLKFEKGSTAVGLKKIVTDKLKATYGMEQTKSDGQTTQTTHRLGGEVQLNDKLSIGADKGILTTPTKQTTVNDGKLDEKINVQFRTKF